MRVKAAGKVVGDFDGNVFKKNVKKSKHLLRVMDAWGIDIHNLNELPPDTRVEIHDSEEKKVYSTSKDVIKHMGVPREFPPHGAQMFLPRKYWKVEPYADTK